MEHLNAAFIKKHWPWLAGGVAVFVLLYLTLGRNSGATASTADVTGGLSGGTIAGLLASQSQQAQLALAAQTEHDQAAIAGVTAATGYLAGEGALAQSVGSAYAGVITAQAQLPAAAIAAGEGVTSTALTSAAGAVAYGVNSVATAIGGYGTAVGNVGQSTAQVIGSIANKSSSGNNPFPLSIGALGGLFGGSGTASTRFSNPPGSFA